VEQRPESDQHAVRDEAARRRRERERRRRKRRKDEDDGDVVGDALDTAEAAVEIGGGVSRLPGCGRSGGRRDCDGCGSGGGSGSGRGGGGCDGCDGPCDFTLLRLSTALLAVSVLMPTAGNGWLVAVLIRGYQRWLTRFTPICPSTPSCSAYALAAVEALGSRRGLAAAAHRIRRCGTR
jgi:hypothetical protein